MRVTVQITLDTLERGSLAPDTLGLQLDEAKGLLCAVQGAIVAEQVRAALAAAVGCPGCGTPRRHKDAREIVVRSLFGALRLPSPRWLHCPCTPHETKTFSPLAALIAEGTTPELRYLEAKFAGLVSYARGRRAERRWRRRSRRASSAPSRIAC
jgi:hypothetical protein